MALITFVPTDWNPGAAPGISADQLDRIEAGIDDLNSGVWGGAISGVTQILAVDAQDADAPEYSFVGKTDWGFMTRLGNRLSFVVAGANVVEASPDGLFAPDGTRAAPGVAFLAQNQVGVFRDGNTVGFASTGVSVAEFNSSSAYSVPNNPNVGQDIAGVDVARIEYTQASFNASITTFSTRSASILLSQLNPHFRLASADSDTNPDKRIAIADEFFGTSGGQEVNTVLVGGWYNFQRIVSTIAIKESVFPWNPALAMPAVIPAPKQAGGAGATPFTPTDLMDVTPVTYALTPDHITARGIDPGEMLGYVVEDVAAKAPWLLSEGGDAIATDAYRMAVVELIRDLRDRVTTLEP